MFLFCISGFSAKSHVLLSKLSSPFLSFKPFPLFLFLFNKFTETKATIYLFLTILVITNIQTTLPVKLWRLSH